MIISFVTLPPNGSTFYQDKHLSGIFLFEDVFVPLYDNMHYYLILADLNSRTRTLNDFELFENKVDTLEEYENAFDTFELPRYPCDHYVSSFGRDLLNFCKTHSIYIVNGRVGQDIKQGEYTYIGANCSSVIDYVLASKIIFSRIIGFSKEPRTESTHMPVLIKLPIKPKQSVKSKGMATYKTNEEISTFSRKKEDIIKYTENISQYFTNEKIIISS